MDYRFFRVNAGGLVDTAQIIRLGSDDAAFHHARAFGNGRAVEVWVRDRKIATIPPSLRI